MCMCLHSRVQKANSKIKKKQNVYFFPYLLDDSVITVLVIFVTKEG